MKFRIGLLVLLTILFGGILAGCNNKEVYRLIKVNSFEGETSMNRAEEAVELFEGIQLVSNDKVTTGSDGLVELLVDSDKNIVASADTCFAIEAVGDETQGKVTINLEYGTTLIEIQNKLTDGSEFEVVTPNATLSVRGTTFEVNYDTVTNETTVSVSDGTVEVTTNVQSRDVNAGETVVVQDVNIVDASDIEFEECALTIIEDVTELSEDEYWLENPLYAYTYKTVYMRKIKGYEVLDGEINFMILHNPSTSIDIYCSIEYGNMEEYFNSIDSTTGEVGQYENADGDVIRTVTDTPYRVVFYAPISDTSYLHYAVTSLRNENIDPVDYIEYADYFVIVNNENNGMQ